MNVSYSTFLTFFFINFIKTRFFDVFIRGINVVNIYVSKFLNRAASIGLGKNCGPI